MFHPALKCVKKLWLKVYLAICSQHDAKVSPRPVSAHAFWEVEASKNKAKHKESPLYGELADRLINGAKILMGML